MYPLVHSLHILVIKNNEKNFWLVEECFISVRQRSSSEVMVSEGILVALEVRPEPRGPDC